MTDLISREVAIEAVKTALLSWSSMPQWRDDKIIDVLAELPSSQPEIIRCKDCKYLFKDNKCPLRTWWTHLENDFCSYGERQENEQADV